MARSRRWEALAASEPGWEVPVGTGMRTCVGKEGPIVLSPFSNSCGRGEGWKGSEDVEEGGK